MDYGKILTEIEQRDYQDTHREIAPLKMARDSVKIDSSDMNVDAVVSAIRQVLEEKVGH